MTAPAARLGRGGGRAGGAGQRGRLGAGQGRGAGCWGWSSSSSGTTGGRRTTTPGSSAAPTTRPATCAWPAWPTHAWAELEWEAEERLVVTTGGLDLFPAGSAIPPGPYRASLEACGVPYQWLDAAEVMRRWPAFRLDADVHGLWQADGGIVPAARGTQLLQRLASGYGATLLDQSPVTAVRDLGGSVEVATADASFRAARLLLCADAWTGDLVAQLGADLPLVVTQEQFSYYRPADPGAFAVGRFPVWIWMDDPSFYGFPVWPGAALKAAQDVGGCRGHGHLPELRPRPGGRRTPGRVPAHPAPRRRRHPRPQRDLPLHPDPGPRLRPRAPPRPRPRPGRPWRRPRVQVRPPARPGPGRPGPARRHRRGHHPVRRRPPGPHRPRPASQLPGLSARIATMSDDSVKLIQSW